MAGVRLATFTLDSPDVGVTFGTLVPLELFEANGEPFMKVDTTKSDNAISMRDGKATHFDSQSRIIPLDMIVKGTTLTYERRKPKPAPKAKPAESTTPA